MRRVADNLSYTRLKIQPLSPLQAKMVLPGLPDKTIDVFMSFFIAVQCVKALVLVLGDDLFKLVHGNRMLFNGDVLADMLHNLFRAQLIV